MSDKNLTSVNTMMKDLMEMLPDTMTDTEKKAIWQQLNFTVDFAQQKIIDQAISKIEGMAYWKDGFSALEDPPKLEDVGANPQPKKMWNDLTD